MSSFRVSKKCVFLLDQHARVHRTHHHVYPYNAALFTGTSSHLSIVECVC